MAERPLSWLERQTSETLESLADSPVIDALYKRTIRDVLTDRATRGRAKKATTPALSVTWDPATQVLTIRPEPISANVVKGWLYHRNAKFRYARYRRDLAAALTSVQQSGHLRFTGPVGVVHEWRTVQARDEDSFGMSLKPVLDAIQEAGIIDDDKHVRLTFGGQEAGGKGARSERCLRLRFLAA
jgi:hypothetical protein